MRHHGDPTGPLGLAGTGEMCAHHGVQPLGGLEDAAPEVVGHRDDVGARHRTSRIPAPVDRAERGELVEQQLVAGDDGETEELRRLGQTHRLQVLRLVQAQPGGSEDRARNVALAGVPHHVLRPAWPGQHAAANPGQHHDQLPPIGHQCPCPSE